MKRGQLGRTTTKFVALPAELGRTANYQFDKQRPIRDVPYVPTPANVVNAMIELAGVSERDVVYDLGCGDGRIVIAAAKQRGCRGVGIDIDQVRIDESKANAIDAGVSDRVRFEQGSAFNVDFREASVVMLYLLPWMTAALRERLLLELRPPSRIVAHNYPLGVWTPDRVVNLPDERRAFLWIVPARVKGSWRVAMRTSDGVLRHGAMELEQEYQTIVGRVTIDDREIELESATLCGTRLSFRAGDATYHCDVDGDSIRGHARSPRTRGKLEFRARRMT